MHVVYKVIFYTHLLGFASVAGGLLFQLPAKLRKIGPVILNGARWQVISGSILYILLGDNANHIAAGLKILGAVTILILAELNRKKTRITNNIYFVMLALVFVQIAVALFVNKN